MTRAEACAARCPARSSPSRPFCDACLGEVDDEEAIEIFPVRAALAEIATREATG